MRRTKKALAALLVLMFGLMTLPVMAAEREYSGFCGDPAVNEGKNITWDFDPITNRLIISGSGNMADYAYGEDAPWHDANGLVLVNTVIFEAGITHIGANAFNADYGSDFLNISFRGPAPESVGADAFTYQNDKDTGVVHVPAEYAEDYAGIVEKLGLEDENWTFSSVTIDMPFEIEGLRLPAAGASPDETAVLHDDERWYWTDFTRWYEVLDGGGYTPAGDYFEEGKEYFLIVGIGDAEIYPEYANAFYDYCYEGADLSGFILPGLGSAEFARNGERWGTGGSEIHLRFGFEGSYITPSSFVPVTDIIDVPDEMAVGETLTLTGTVIPETAGRQISYWEMLSSETTATVILDEYDGATFTATTTGTVRVRAIVERGHSIEGDPALEDDPTTWMVDESKDFWKDFTITVKTAEAPTIDGPNSMTVTEGYEAASTSAFELAGWPTPEVTKLSGDSRITWNSATKKLDIAPGLTQGDYTVTLKASNDTDSDEHTFTLTVKPLGTVTGEVRYDHNDPKIVDIEEDTMFVSVSLWQGGNRVNDTDERLTLILEEDMSDYYSFSGVADGWYTVVAEGDYTITRDVYMKGGVVADPPEVIVFTPGKTQTVLVIDPGANVPNVATNDLPDLFLTNYGEASDPPYDTEYDSNHLAGGGEVEFRLDVADASVGDRAELDGAITSNGLRSVLFLDLTLTKTLYDTSDQPLLNPAPRLLGNVFPAVLEIVVPVPPGQTITAVYRIHGGDPETLPGSPGENNEYFRFDADKDTVYLYVNQFSAYALAVTAPTGNAGGNGGSATPVSDLTLNKDEISLVNSESETLIAIVTPSGASDKSVTWTSSDPSVATVDRNGKVTAVKPGTTVITARSNSSGYRDTCVVTVVNGSQLFITDHMAYIVGYPDGTIGPNNPLTRAEAATVFFRLLTDEVRAENWTQDNAFTDVSEDSWYNNAVSVMIRLGIVNGNPDETFHPYDSITRAELAAIAARFARHMGLTGANEIRFSDINGHWAAADIQYAATIGWMNGYTDGTFGPDRNITRAEFLALVNRMLERIPETTDDLLTDEMITWPDNTDLDAWYYIAVQEATNSHEAEYKDTMVPGLPFNYETWTEIVPNRDWAELEER